MSALDTCETTAEFLINGVRVGSRCIMAPGHAEPVVDRLTCASCGNAEANHRMAGHALVPTVRPGTEHVVHLRWSESDLLLAEMHLPPELCGNRGCVFLAGHVPDLTHSWSR